MPLTVSWTLFPSYQLHNGNMVCMTPTTVFDLFIISYGQAGTHFILKKITPNKTTLSIIIKCGGILLFQFQLDIFACLIFLRKLYYDRISWKLRFCIKSNIPKMSDKYQYCTNIEILFMDLKSSHDNRIQKKINLCSGSFVGINVQYSVPTLIRPLSAKATPTRFQIF